MVEQPLGSGMFERMLNAVGQAVMMTDLDGTIVYWNRAAESMYGWSKSEVVGRHILDVTPAAESAEHASAIIRQRAAGDSWSGEFLVRRRDGSTFPALVSDSPMVDDSGQLTHIIGVSSDLTDRVNTERRFRAAFDAAPSGCAFADLTGRVTMANDAYCSIVGHTRDEIVGQHLSEFAPIDDRSGQTAALRSMVDGEGDILSGRQRCITGTDAVRTLDVSLRLVRGHNGRPEYFVGHFEDVTEWLETQELIRVSADQHRQLLRNVVIALGASLELADPFTAGHQRRTSTLAAAIGERLTLDATVCEGIAIGATIHDIGKIATPAEILAKPTRLDEAEVAVVRRHPLAGDTIVESLDLPWPIGSMIREHHERVDGSGYPLGLSGDETTLEARIIAVADTVEVLASHRPYKRALPVEAAMEIMAADRGRLFDRDVVDACSSVFRDGMSLPQQD